MQTQLKKDIDGFVMRGEAMNRIEAFVAATFAFAITMLVVSLEDIPTNYDELLQAAKLIPSFAASCAIVMTIWHSHAKWSRRYGLEDGPTILISCILIFVVLIYIYPLRILMQGLFSSLSDRYFPFLIDLNTVEHIRFMFAFAAIGFLTLSLTFVALYGYALKQKSALSLSEVEEFRTRSDCYSWLIVACVAFVSSCMALLMPPHLIVMSGHVNFAIIPLSIGLKAIRKRQLKRILC